MKFNVDRWTTVACVLLIALSIRLAVVAVGYSSLSEDPDSYARMAVAWSKSATFGLLDADGVTPRPTAYRPPLYPWMLSWFVERDRLSLGAVAAIHILLGCATVWLTLLIGWALQIRLAWVAALAVSLDPLLLRASQQVMTETLATFLAVLAWYCWLRGTSAQSRCGSDESKVKEQRLAWIAVLGIVLGLSILARPTAAPWALWLALTMAFWSNTGKESSGALSRVTTGDRLSGFAIVGFAICLTILPWTVRNWLALGKPIWATTHGGYTLLLANNPSLYEHFSRHGPSRAWDAKSFHAHWAARGQGDPSQPEFWSGNVAQNTSDPDFEETRDDQLAYEAARATIARQPAMFARSCLYRVLWLWMPFPYQAELATSTLAIGAWYSCWFIAAAIGVLRLGRARYQAGWLAAAGLILSLTLIHAIYWSNMRMRAPAMPAVYLFACASYCPTRDLLIKKR